MKRSVVFMLVLVCSFVGVMDNAVASELKIGTAKADITPPGVIPLWGQWHMRLSKSPQTPLSANIAVVESSENGKTLDRVIFVSADLLQISEELLQAVQKKVVARVPEIDPEKIVINGTHTHTAPVLSSRYASKLPANQGITSLDEILDFISTRIADAVVQAWKSRVPGCMAFGLDFAAVAQSRRIVYHDGTAKMYGQTNDTQFNHIEGMEDQDVNTLFFWDTNDKLLAIVINVSCPSQVVEGLSVIDADYWLEVRNVLYKRFGSDVTILGLCGAAGDLSPRPAYCKEASQRMNKLRKLSDMQEIARKIDLAVADTYAAVKDAKVSDVPLIHKVKTIQLPMRLVTDEEYVQAKQIYDGIMAKLAADPKKSEGEVAFMATGWQKSIIDRYERQKKNPNPLFATVIHVIRLGDVAICTNQFELFTAFGVQMKAWSPAIQTLVVQLVGNGTYLPTAKAVKGGSYSAIIGSNLVGPEGGQVLVNETVSLLKELWPSK